MHLISALAGGCAGAENGSARLYQRGTATRATWYEDFEGTAANSSGTDIPLDSDGAAIVYVNEYVLVQVYDDQGELLRRFVAGDAASAVELRSLSFSGVDYDSGATADGNPIPLGAALDLWKASAGATNWDVLFNGASTRLQDALGGITRLFYNVKSPQYGAVGNGVVNDAPAIQAAHDAALAAGGGVVVFPPGIYNLSVALNWNIGVTAICSPGTAQLISSSASDSVIKLNGNAFFGPLQPRSTVFYGLEFTNSVNNTAAEVLVDYNNNLQALYFFNCRWGGANTCQGVSLQIQSDPGLLVVVDCLFDPRADKSCIRHVAAPATKRFIAEGCEFNFPAVAPTQPMVYSLNAELHLRNCLFNGSAASGNCIAVTPDINAPVLISACRFKKLAAGATNYGVKITNGAMVLMDADCSFDAQTLRFYQAVESDVLAEGSRLAFGPFLTFGVSAQVITLPDDYEKFYIPSTNNTGITPQLPKAYVVGQSAELLIHNSSGVAWGAAPLVTVGGTGQVFDSRATWPAALNNQYFSARFTFIGLIAAVPTWVQAGGASPAMP